MASRGERAGSASPRSCGPVDPGGRGRTGCAAGRRPGVPASVRAALAVLACAVLPALAGACRESAGASLTTDAGGDPSYGGTVVVAGPNDLDAANILVTAEKYTRELLRFALFTPLVRYDEELDYVPYLARSWEMVGDTGVVFHLRDDVYWHDGVKTTAYDVAFTYTRAKDPATAFPNASYFERWSDVEVVDSFTVRFGFEPHADPLAGLPFTPVMPRHLLEEVPPAELRQAEFSRAPVGNGPFRFVSYRTNDRWVFEANPDFPEELGGRPYVDRLVWRVVPEYAAQVTELLTGNIDLALNPPTPRVRELDEEPGVGTIVKPSRQYAFIGWNGRRAPFGDPRVRRAISMAIDRREVLDVLRAGYGTLAVGPIAPYHWAYDESLDPLSHDPEAARALLTEAGLRDRDDDGVLENAAGEDFSFDLELPAGSGFSRNMAEMIQADLARIGVRMGIRSTEATTFIQHVSSPERDFDAALLGLQAEFRIDLYDLFHSEAMDGPFQMASYSNPEVDRLLDRVADLSDRDEASAVWHRVQAILKEEQPWSFLYYYPDVYLVRDRVRGVRMDIRGAFVNVTEWWLASAESSVS